MGTDMANKPYSTSGKLRPTPFASNGQAMPHTMSRRHFLRTGLAGIGGALMASTPLAAYGQGLEPFIPAPNSLSNGPSSGINTGKPGNGFHRGNAVLCHRDQSMGKKLPQRFLHDRDERP